MKPYHFFVALLLLSAQISNAQAPIAQNHPALEPVYIYLYARVTDQVNLDISEDRLRRLLPMIEHFRAEHPDAHLSATILFSGASSQALDQRNSKSHIKDFVLDYKKRGVIEVGYDGTDEPTYEHRPLVTPVDGSTSSGRWLARAAADERFLTEGRDPLTGVPSPGSVGGLAEMQRVFGEAACIKGVSAGEVMKSTVGPGATGVNAVPNVKPEVGDWEIIPVLRRYNTKAILFGFPETNPANIPGFKTSIQGIGRMESPIPESSPELFWADNVLRFSESSGGPIPVTRVLHGYEGPDKIRDSFSKLERSRVHIIHMELASETDYVKPDFSKTSLSPSLSYAYAHPESPQLPALAKLSADEVNATYKKEADALNWIASTYFPQNSGSRFVSSSDIQRMTAPSNGYSISVAALSSALTDLLAKWGNDTFLPDYIFADGHYLSLAEMFQVMTDSLAELDRAGKLPQSVHVVRLYGPITMMQGHGPNVGEVSVASIAKTCAQIAARLHDDTANPMPRNTVPAGVTVDGIGMNSAQFLRLMAQAMVHPVPETKLPVKMTYMFPGVAEIYPKTRPMEDTGATWTFKPAPLDIQVAPTRASR